MIKYGCMALVAVACAAVVPAAHAEGKFFVAGHLGRATFDDTGFDDDSASTRALSGGYRWQAGPILQVGVEASLGKVDEVGDRHDFRDAYGYDYIGSAGFETHYQSIGANARINLGKDSRWFAVARLGYMAYDMDGHADMDIFDNGVLVQTYADSLSESGGGAYFGAGIGVDATRNLSFSLNYSGYAYSDFETNYEDEIEIGTASTTTLGVEVRF